MCPSEPLEVGPPAGPLSPAALLHLPSLLRRLRAAVELERTRPVNTDRFPDLFSYFTDAVPSSQTRVLILYPRGSMRYCDTGCL